MEEILVVDDSDDVRRIVADTLRGCGYHVFEAATAAEALGILGSQSISFAICDLHLDGRTSGAALLDKAVRLHPGLQGALMSGSMLPGQRLKTPFPVLSKPFPPRMLLDLASAVLHSKR